MLIATAGHIDHGKTALVRALTGTDTDRLPEEKARGISIELGFAYWRPEAKTDEGEPIGFVDVPGHERFVRTMIAGVSGVDFALLVVAADDGIMPQTAEHVAVLGLLGLKRGAVALTKADKVSPARIAAVQADVAALLAPTGLAGAPMFPVSALSGQGIAALAAHLREAALHGEQAITGGFRMAVDRAFTMAGAGTVATGTVLAGRLAAGDMLTLSPSGKTARVRSLQSAGVPVAKVRAGQRCAVNLPGVELGDVSRGDWLVTPAFHAPTRRIVVRLHVLPERSAPLRHGAALRLHIGTADLPARLLSRRGEPVLPGTERLVTLALDAPTLAVNGQHFVLRDGSGQGLIGGGRVIDPLAPPRRRADGARDAVHAALEAFEAKAALAALLTIEGFEVPAGWFAQSFGLTASELPALVTGCAAEALGRAPGLILPASRIGAVGDGIIALLADWHRDHPEEGGLTLRDLGRHLPLPVSPEALGAVLRRLADKGQITMAGTLARLPGHQPSFAAAEVALWQALGDLLGEEAPRIVTAAELAPLLGAAEATVRTMLYRRRIAGDLWAVTDARFLTRDAAAALAASAASIAASHGGMFTAAQFRDGTGMGRNHVIRCLEFFDRIGVTQRRGDARAVRTAYRDVVGEAEAWLV